MKKIVILIFSVLLSAVVVAQLPVAAKVKNLGTCSPGKIVAFNNSLTDTLASADTLFYKLLVNHTTEVYPYISQLKKLVAADTTAILTLWQSVDGSNNWQVIKHGLPSDTATVAYVKTIAKGTTGNDYSGWRSNIKFESQYFGMRFIAKTKTGSKNIFYGSIRFNEK